MKEHSCGMAGHYCGQVGKTLEMKKEMAATRLPLCGKYLMEGIKRTLTPAQGNQNREDEQLKTGSEGKGGKDL